jgi:hypothetical protein
VQGNILFTCQDIMSCQNENETLHANRPADVAQTEVRDIQLN